jgi:hypothetical protein
MTRITDLTASQIERIISIKEEIEKLQAQLESIADGTTTPARAGGKRRRKRRMSAAGRARIAAGAKARWAKVHAKAKAAIAPKKADRRMSPAVKAKLAAIAKARWANVKAAGKTTL